MLQTNARPSQISPEVTPLESLELGQTYRLKRREYLSYNHTPLYDEGRHIHVKVLSGPDSYGIYQCTTRDEQGQHLGSGGGWVAESEKSMCRFRASDLEVIPLS